MKLAVLEMVRQTDPPPPPPPDSPLEQLVHLHLRGVWRFLRLLGCARDEADDLTQETFIIAFRKGLSDRSPPQVAAFLRRTARHLFLRSRHQRDRRARLLAAAAESLWQRSCAADGGDRRISALRECLAELATKARQLVRMFYAEGRSRAEVAASLGMQETGVKTALQRTRSTLKECVGRKIG